MKLKICNLWSHVLQFDRILQRNQIAIIVGLIFNLIKFSRERLDNLKLQFYSLFVKDIPDNDNSSWYISEKLIEFLHNEWIYRSEKYALIVHMFQASGIDWICSTNLISGCSLSKIETWIALDSFPCKDPSVILFLWTSRFESEDEVHYSQSGFHLDLDSPMHLKEFVVLITIQLFRIYLCYIAVRWF